jgi:hypothetical protein
MLRRLMLDNELAPRRVHDNPLDPADGMLYVNLQLVRQHLSHYPHKPARISIDHAIQRLYAALLPLGVNVRNESLTKLIT